MQLFSSFLLVCILRQCFVAYANFPEKVSAFVLANEGDQSCPSDHDLDAGIQSLKEEIEVVLRLLSSFTCPCAGSGLWRRIAFLNASDTNQQCPPNWPLTTSPVRGCGRSSPGVRVCDSAFFQTGGRAYSRVCGRVNAYQKGSPNAFNMSVSGTNISLEDAYLDGISLTHGAAGSRQHIWSFAASIYETDSGYRPEWNCACTNVNRGWPYRVPNFIGNNYFCATGNPGPGSSNTIVYGDNSLWDGEECGSQNTCCQFNNPPWFCTTLPRSTTDDIELRICQDQDADNEDVLVSLVEIAVN